MIRILLLFSLSAIAVLGILFVIRVRDHRLMVQIWHSLQSEPTSNIFTSEMIAELDEPVQRYFLHAIEPGTPIANYVELKMSGGFRSQPDQDWLPMQASQIISTSPGFIWKATIGKGINKLSGADYYYQNKSKMRFSLWGLIPVVNAQDENVKRSAAGRLAGEYALWLPSALLPQNGVIWKAIAHNTIQADFKIDDEPITLTLTINNDGKLLEMYLKRWGNKTEDGSWKHISFGGEIQSLKTFGGYTVVSQLTAGWWFGTDKYSAFFQPIIEQATYR